jgi:hypothetical protein
MTPLFAIGIIGFLLVLLALLTRSIRAGRAVVLRPLRGYEGLKGQLGRAIESGSQLHVTLGQASLISNASPTSIAAAQILAHLAKDGCANNTPPLVTVGEGTLLPIAQANMQAAYQQAGQPGEFDDTLTQFVAHETDPFAYGGGVAAAIQENRVASNVMVGRFGIETAIIAEAANRKNIDQVIGTDAPVAMALATAVTDNLLIGEELLAAGAYLEGTPSQIASLQLQDILRWLIVIAILGVTIFQFV